MKEKLTQYVDGLFRSAAFTVKNAELREEILQNTLEKYDDLRSDGKSEAEAYQAAVDGIGDISQLIEPAYVPPQPPAEISAQPPVQEETIYSAFADDFDEDADFKTRKKVFGRIKSSLWLLFTAGYILWSFVSGAWHITWIIFLLAPALMSVMDAIFYWNIAGCEKKVRGACSGALWLIVTSLYFVLSFGTGAWHITWILFLIAAALSELLRACLSMRGD